MTTTPTTPYRPTVVVTVRETAPLLPKIAFVLIGLASLLGTALSNRGLGVPLYWLAPRWIALWACAAAIGFLVWRVAYLHEADGDDAADYLADVRRRARVVARLLAPLALASVPAVMVVGYLDGRSGTRWTLAVASLVLAGLLLRGIDHRGRAMAALVIAAALTVGWGLADAGDGLAGLWRVLHLCAFGLWIGGALWNLTVAIPVGSRHPTIEAVTSGALQLQRFRRVARAALPTVVVTGLLMALPYLTGAGDLLATTAGRFILAKIGLIVALVVIFITCPLYRQCSPVSGVCDIEDLQEPPRPQSSAVRS